MRLRFPDGLDASGFLRDYWQKRPLLMRAAFDPADFPLDAGELAGLALQPDVEGRLVTGNPRSEFTVCESPFSDSELSELPASDWTLLVQDVDKHWPELAQFCDLFDFIPRWRFDDLMISLAAPGGGVGPHFDQYDVFLCQHAGERRWQLASPGAYRERAGVSLRQIEGFVAEQTMTLVPGDVLYLPPGLPHDGVAGSLCSTWSVGFRAPTREELFAGFGQKAAHSGAEQRYSDPDLQVDEALDGLLGSRALARFSRLLGTQAPEKQEYLAEQLGRFLTTPKAWLRPEAPEPPIRNADFVRRLGTGEQLFPHGMALFLQAETNGQKILFASGSGFEVPPGAEGLACTLAVRRAIIQQDLTNLHRPALDFLCKLYNAGQLMFESDYHEF